MTEKTIDQRQISEYGNRSKKTVGMVSGKPKRKGGRPKLTIKREAFIRVRLTATEHFVIAGRAKEANIRIIDWFRSAAKAARVVSRLNSEDMQITRMLTGMANNLNQLTKLAHKDGMLGSKE